MTKKFLLNLCYIYEEFIISLIVEIFGDLLIFGTKHDKKCNKCWNLSNKDHIKYYWINFNWVGFRYIFRQICNNYINSSASYTVNMFQDQAKKWESNGFIFNFSGLKLDSSSVRVGSSSHKSVGSNILLNSFIQHLNYIYQELQYWLFSSVISQITNLQ